MMPTISVVIPTRDRRELAIGAVRNALAQDWPALEVVVVDDGSTPPLALPPDLLADPRVRLERQAPRGAAAARNRGVAVTTGPLIAFLDDDDRWRPGKLPAQARMMAAAARGAAAVESGYEVWTGGRPRVRHLPDPGRDLATSLLAQPHLQPSSTLVRRDAFTALGGFDESLMRTEDWELAVRLAERYAVVADPVVRVDRRASEVGPVEALLARRRLIERLRPRIDALPPSERRRVRAWHGLVSGVLLAQAGRRGPAARTLLRAWAVDPRSPRPLMHLGRLVTGERLWALARDRRRRTVSRAG
jgi:glycosyltransferase involved in cell wall biosynthesis